MYLTSFVHRDELFEIAERWFRGRCHPTDAFRLTQILICDGYVIGETLKRVGRHLIEIIHRAPFREERIHFKGELRDALCRCTRGLTPRVESLFHQYWRNPDFYYREAPVNGVMCLDGRNHLIGMYRIKRPVRIAEKANRYIANWIFGIVKRRASEMAEERARQVGVPLASLYTPEQEMVQEFIRAEESVARGFSEGTVHFDRAALTINDVAGIKIVGEKEELMRLKTVLSGDPTLIVMSKETHSNGNYRDISFILDVPCDHERVCRQFSDSDCWKNYPNRGVPEDHLKKGLEPLLRDGKPNISIELILTTFPDLVESELGSSIHEERIVAQRDNRDYKGYIPTNIEFLISYLFAVGFSPQTTIESVPIKLWGRYLPDTLSSCIRRLYRLPEYDLFY